MRWPEKITANTVTDVPVNSVDFYPTFLEAASTENPAGNIMDGASLVPLIANKKAPERDAMFWHIYLKQVSGNQEWQVLLGKVILN